MWVMQLIGRLAGSVVDVPFSAAENAVQNGTARAPTDAEMAEAGVDTRQVVETANPALLPLGYLAEATEGGGYDVKDAAGLPINIEPFPNLPAAISGAHEHRNAVYLPVTQIPIDQIPPAPLLPLWLERYRFDGVEGGGFDLFDGAGARIGDEAFANEDAAQVAARQHYAASRGLTIEQLEAEEAEAPMRVEVAVPDTWQNLHHTQRRALAQQITGQTVTSTKVADEVIEEYLTRP